MATCPRLDTLPNELLIEIFSYLAPIPSRIPKATPDAIEDKEKHLIRISLRNLKAVCRNFSTLVTPLIQAHYHDGDFYCLKRNGEDFTAWEKVKSIILDKRDWDVRGPDSDTFQKYLSLRGIDQKLGLSEVWNDEHGADNDYDDSPSPLDQDAFRGYLMEDGVDDAMQTNYERAAILCLCPNVEEILYGSVVDDHWRDWSLDKDFFAIEPLVYAGLGKPFGRVHAFSHLRYLSIDVQYMALNLVAAIFRIPSLRHLVLEWRDYGKTGWSLNDVGDNWQCPDGASNVDILELRHVQTASLVVRRLLRSCRALRKLEVDFQMTSGAQLHWFQDVCEELKTHKSTLEELTFTSFPDPVCATREPTLGADDLQLFKELKRLHIPFQLIAGYHSFDEDFSNPVLPDLRKLFPPSIQSIEVDFSGALPYAETTEAFSSLIGHPDKLPLLERVHVTVYMRHLERGFCDQGYPLPMDFHSLATTRIGKTNIEFDYTLLYTMVYTTKDIELAREKMLALPHGKEIIKHASSTAEKKWSEWLSRDIDAPHPYRSLEINNDHARSMGWLRDSMSAEELEEEVKKLEARSL